MPATPWRSTLLSSRSCSNTHDELLMARVFNGTSDHAESAFDLSGESIITVAFWFFYPTYYNDTVHTMLEYSDPVWTQGGFLFIPWGDLGPGGFKGYVLGVATSTGSSVWIDASANNGSTVQTWQQATVVYDRTGPSFTFYLDGSLKSLATVLHQAGSYGNFANANQNFFSRNAGGSLFGAGRIAEFAIWSGDVLGQNVGAGLAASWSLPQALAVGVPPPYAISQQPLVYIPWLGYDSPEPDYSGNQYSASVTGALAAPHPGSRTLLMPGSGAS